MSDQEQPKSVFDTISELTGMSHQTMDKVFQEVKANQAKLDTCKGPHDFSRPYKQCGQLVTDWSCSKCGGHIPMDNKRWYEKGLKHGIHTVAAV